MEALEQGLSVQLQVKGRVEVSTPGFTRNLEDGILTWKLPLAFHVDVPQDYATGF